MKSIWTLASYPAASLAGYFIALGTRDEIADIAGLDPMASTVGILVISGLVVGFLVDEVIPTYIHDVREGGTGSDLGGGDFDSGGDFDFE